MSLCGGLLAVTLLAAADRTADVAAGLADFRQGQFAEALQDWVRAADAGDARGALYIGVLYDTGLGVRQDYQQAMAWYRRAADGGSAAGAFNVGVLYDSGLGVEKNASQAATWYGVAASRQFGRAEYNLGMLYESGTGVKPSHQHAVALYKRAAGHGISAARAHLAALGQAFNGPARPTPDSAMAAFQQAQHLILSRSAEDVARATSLFRHSAEQHEPRAEYDLGYCYEHGLGVPYDEAQALNWYRRAAGDTTDAALRSAAQAGAAYMARNIAREHAP